MEKRQLSGYAMFGVGFAMLLFNAFCYIFNWDLKSPVSSIIGIIFFCIGLTIARKPPV
jgi:phosphate/sulfate permease